MEKCTFRVPRGKLVGYIITERGIKANPNKIFAIAKIVQVRNVKDIQQLMGCLMALNHFMSRLGERRLPIYKLLKKSDSFHWMDETQKTLDKFKALISKLSILASLEPGETLLLYITATTQVVSATLVVKREEPRHVYKVQRLVFYISKLLSDCETSYNQVQTLLYAVLIMKRRILHYFKSQLIHVVTSYGLREIVRNHLTMGRIAKWALELMGLYITYVPQTAIKSQDLVDFMAEWSEKQHPPPSPWSTGACISMVVALSTGSREA
jgi:hypothetical protein